MIRWARICNINTEIKVCEPSSHGRAGLSPRDSPSQTPRHCICAYGRGVQKKIGCDHNAFGSSPLHHFQHDLYCSSFFVGSTVAGHAVPTARIMVWRQWAHAGPIVRQSRPLVPACAAAGGGGGAVKHGYLNVTVSIIPQTMKCLYFLELSIYNFICFHLPC
jgi:hypothetical protein